MSPASAGVTSPCVSMNSLNLLHICHNHTMIKSSFISSQNRKEIIKNTFIEEKYMDQCRAMCFDDMIYYIEELSYFMSN